MMFGVFGGSTGLATSAPSRFLRLAFGRHGFPNFSCRGSNTSRPPEVQQAVCDRVREDDPILSLPKLHRLKLAVLGDIESEQLQGVVVQQRHPLAVRMN